MDQKSIQNTINEQLQLTQEYFKKAEEHAYKNEDAAMSAAYGAAQACFEALDRWIKRYKTIPDEWK